VCVRDYLGHLVAAEAPVARRQLDLMAQQKQGNLTSNRETMCVCVLVMV
jgi:hypothetical protein